MEKDARGSGLLALQQLVGKRRPHTLHLLVQKIEVQQRHARNAHPPRALSVAVDGELGLMEVMSDTLRG